MVPRNEVSGVKQGVRDKMGMRLPFIEPAAASLLRMPTLVCCAFDKINTISGTAKS